jgi:transcription initiation factor TFIIIB Brf1 subunit/transcription initiation factor TFIIB
MKPTPETAKTKRVNLGLAISGACLNHGETRTLYEIACFCNCSKQAIEHIEKKALRKLRKILLKHQEEFPDKDTTNEFRTI